MRFPLDRNKCFVISIGNNTDSRLVFHDVYRKMYIYEMSKEYMDVFEVNGQECIRYLDMFIMVLPENKFDKELLWKSFYEYFGEIYNELIDVKNNMACITEMIQHIERDTKKYSQLILLDYGCGNGVAAKTITTHVLYGYEPVETMQKQAVECGVNLIGREEIKQLPNEFFDAVFSCYVFHMVVFENDILDIMPKIKKGAPWIVNYYKGINEGQMNAIFLKHGFSVRKIHFSSERFGSVYEYKRS